MDESIPYFVPAGSGHMEDNVGRAPSQEAGPSRGGTCNFQGHTLILPTVSHASVPQLAVDLLLQDESLLKLRFSGRINAGRDVMPLVGALDGPGVGITTSFEVYSNETHRVTVLQQRSPVLRSRKRSFVATLTSWIKQQGFSRVLLLSSVDASLRIDQELQLGASPLAYVDVYDQDSAGSTNDVKPATVADELIDRVHKVAQPLVDAAHQKGKARASLEQHSRETNQDSAAHLPGASIPHLDSSTGLLRPLLLSLAAGDSASQITKDQSGSTASVPATALVLWVAEGDNRPDAPCLAGIVRDQILQLTPAAATTKTPVLSEAQEKTGLVQSSLREPPSWQGLFGNRADQAVFG